MPDKHLDALDYHSQGRPGKIEVIPTKPTQSQRDLSMAYSPGVALPCQEIAKDKENVYKYTAKGNLVAVISNGTAVLGLGDLGPEASKPVMEGKGILFKIFADIDVFDLELDCKTVDDFVNTVKALEPTFGGINLEDIKAPESFEIEQRLKEEMGIPVMHDDQHGTAIISGAALLNALKLVQKDIKEVKMVVNGAGASAIACGKIFQALGVSKENMLMFDSKGVLHKGRVDLDPSKEFFARDVPPMELKDAVDNADVFIGLSKGGILSKEMVRSMAKDPIVFALANPDPEISYEDAMDARSDVIMATGRSDHPNQVNNVLGFPFIFRGALDVRATAINEEMKLAAVHALAKLAQDPVPDVVNMAYNQMNLMFGKDYIIPKPIDPRLITAVAPAVARAAIESNVAKNPITDWDAYERTLKSRLGLDNKFIRRIVVQAKQDPKRVVFAEADNLKILKAAQTVKEDGTAIPILLGKREKIVAMIQDNKLTLEESTIIDPYEEDEMRERFADVLFEKRKRRGVTRYDAVKLMRDRNYFGTLMVESGEADAFISGLTKNYPSAVRPALQVIGKRADVEKVAGMYVLLTRMGPLFFADTTINIEPSWEDLVQLVKLTHENVLKLQVEPRIALISYSNFGSTRSEEGDRIQQAVNYLHKHHPEIVVDGEMQANFALDVDLRNQNFPFSKLGEESANTLIFPNLTSGNAAYKIVQQLGVYESIGPILMGFKKSIHVLQLGSSVREIINMINVAVVDAQSKEIS